ncbi:unnamed protein product, partial [Discosporangium mesarthrocarpum]
FSSGVGTAVVGISRWKLELVVIGGLQLMLTFAVVGWLWSVLWGFELYHRSQESAVGDEPFHAEDVSGV